MQFLSLPFSTARVLCACALLSLAACANGPLKSDKLELARDAVNHAAQMGGNDYAAGDMQAARERIEQAQLALTNGSLSRADALADEALVNTRLAEARVQSAKAQLAAAELRKGNRALQTEIQNNLK
jgi:hypothetical protein